MTRPIILVQLSSGSVPRYATPGAAGLDIEAAADVTVEPHSRVVVPTGLALEIPAGYEGQIRPRSGLSSRTRLTVHLGTIDSDYRGQVGVIVENCGPAPFAILRGMRIAQLVVAPVARVEILQVNELGCSERGGGGFGSTGQ
jgi:dUTP pyrophosphatase